MNFSLNIPSYRRPIVKSLGIAPWARVWVCETEADHYREMNEGADVVAMPKGVQGNISRVRNYILDESAKQGFDAVAMIDDDIQYFGYYEAGEALRIDPLGLEEWMRGMARMGNEMGVRLVGVNISIAPKFYRVFTPFSLSRFIGGPFSIHLNSPIRYDERMPLKEDYDLFIQHMNQYRRVLRFNKFHYKCNQGATAGSGQTGGCASMRSIIEEERQFDLLQKKWGTNIVRRDSQNESNKRKTIDLNPVVSVPIKGA